MLAHFSRAALKSRIAAPASAAPQTPERNSPAWVPVSTANGV